MLIVLEKYVAMVVNQYTGKPDFEATWWYYWDKNQVRYLHYTAYKRRDRECGIRFQDLLHDQAIKISFSLVQRTKQSTDTALFSFNK